MPNQTKPENAHQEYETPKEDTESHKGLIYGLVASVIFIVFIGLFLKYNPFYQKNIYVIPNVPELSLYSDEILNSRYRESGAGTLFTLLRYWGEEVYTRDQKLFEDIMKLFSDNGIRVNATEDFLNSRGYNFETVKLSSLKELSKFINKNDRTPLLFGQPVTTTYPDFPLFKLLIGVDEKNKTVTFDEFDFGPNKTIPFEEFENLWALHPYQDFKHTYYIVSPKNDAVIAHLITQPEVRPSIRNENMGLGQPVLLLYLLGVSSDNPSLKVTYYTEAVGHIGFGLIHPLFQTLIYSGLIREEILLGDIDLASKQIETLLSLNKNLDAQYTNLPTYKFNEISHPYFTIARYYQAIGNEQKTTEWRDAGREVEKNNFGESGADDPNSPWFEG